jgi:transposase InsO family protein
MDIQKIEVLKFVAEQRQRRQRIKTTLNILGVARSSYYRWNNGNGIKLTEDKAIKSVRILTPEEIDTIDRAIDENHGKRHRQIQGILQNSGIYISASSIYCRMKQLGILEPYNRRPSPMKSALYEGYRRNIMWGCDWTRLKIGGVRWYLLTIIDFFSRLIVAYRIVPSVHAGVVKASYYEGLLSEKILSNKLKMPLLRVDRGSPNTSWVTREFFEIIGAELSFARVCRPTDNAITERFYGTIKQEEIYLVGNYPDEVSASREVGSYIDYYNNSRPHQALWNFTPKFVHDLNNKTDVQKYLKDVKRKALENRRRYWINHQKSDLQKNEFLSHLEKT